jgi:hypothetical protein
MAITRMGFTGPMSAMGEGGGGEPPEVFVGEPGFAGWQSAVISILVMIGVLL